MIAAIHYGFINQLDFFVTFIVSYMVKLHLLNTILFAVNATVEWARI